MERKITLLTKYLGINDTQGHWAGVKDASFSSYSGRNSWGFHFTIYIAIYTYSIYKYIVIYIFIYSKIYI